MVNRIDATELPEDEKAALARKLIDGEGGATHIRSLKQDAAMGEFDPTPRTFTTDMHGDSPEAALGRAYKIRDTIEERTDSTVTCELTGKQYQFPSTVFYEVRITVNGGQ